MLAANSKSVFISLLQWRCFLMSIYVTLLLFSLHRIRMGTGNTLQELTPGKRAQLMGYERGRDWRQEGNLLIFNVPAPWPFGKHQWRSLASSKSRKSFYRRETEAGDSRSPFQAGLSFGCLCFFLKHGPVCLTEILDVVRGKPEGEPRRAGCLTWECRVRSQSSWRYNPYIKGRKGCAAGVQAKIVSGRKYSPNL